MKKYKVLSKTQFIDKVLLIKDADAFTMIETLMDQLTTEGQSIIPSIQKLFMILAGPNKWKESDREYLLGLYTFLESLTQSSVLTNNDISNITQTSLKLLETHTTYHYLESVKSYIKIMIRHVRLEVEKFVEENPEIDTIDAKVINDIVKSSLSIIDDLEPTDSMELNIKEVISNYMELMLLDKDIDEVTKQKFLKGLEDSLSSKLIYKLIDLLKVDSDSFQKTKLYEKTKSFIDEGKTSSDLFDMIKVASGKGPEDGSYGYKHLNFIEVLVNGLKDKYPNVFDNTRYNQKENDLHRDFSLAVNFISILLETGLPDEILNNPELFLHKIWEENDPYYKYDGLINMIEKSNLKSMDDLSGGIDFRMDEFRLVIKILSKYVIKNRSLPMEVRTGPLTHKLSGKEKGILQFALDLIEGNVDLENYDQEAYEWEDIYDAVNEIIKKSSIIDDPVLIIKNCMLKDIAPNFYRIKNVNNYQELLDKLNRM